jgi:pilus assembly protein CpaB
MRNKSALTMIAVSVLMGLAAVVLAAQWLGQQASLATNKVVVAARDIPLGSPLTPDIVRSVDWPSGSLPDGAIQNEKDLESRVVKTSLLRGEPILETKLAPVGTKGGLSSLISEGRRAITVKVNEVIGVAGFALPGNHVDVMVNTKDDADKPISKIVLEQILVLAVAQEANRDETKPKVVNAVTLEVTPDQAEKLDLARSIGQLSLVLRNQLDKNMVPTDGARRAELLKVVAAPRPEVKPQPGKPVARPRVAATPVEKKADKEKVEVIKGVHKSSVEL